MLLGRIQTHTYYKLPDNSRCTAQYGAKADGIAHSD